MLIWHFELARCGGKGPPLVSKEGSIPTIISPLQAQYLCFISTAITPTTSILRRHHPHQHNLHPTQRLPPPPPLHHHLLLQHHTTTTTNTITNPYTATTNGAGVVISLGLGSPDGAHPIAPSGF